MNDNVHFLIGRLNNESKKIHQFFCSLKRKDWDVIIYNGDEIWTVKSIFSHLVSSESGFVKLFGEIKSGSSGVPENFDIDQFNKDQELINQDRSIEELLTGFVQTRQELILFVNSLDDDELDIKGRHPFLGVTTLSEMLKLVYRHDQLHFHDIRKILDKKPE